MEGLGTTLMVYTCTSGWVETDLYRLLPMISVIITGSVHYIPLLIVQSELPEVERRPPAEEDVVARLPEVPTEPPTLGRL